MLSVLLKWKQIQNGGINCYGNGQIPLNIKLFIWINMLKKQILGTILLRKEELAQIFAYYEARKKNILII